jgi:hypothetical protein
MPGRHQAMASRRSKLRLLAGIACGAVIGAIVLATTAASAGAAGDPVKATFSVLGVTSSNCPNLDIGGSDVYVLPGQELDANTALAGLNLLGLVGAPSGLAGKLVIDPKSSNPKSYDLTNKATALPSLTTGNHAYRFTATNLLGLSLGSLVDLSKLLKAGAKLTWDGTIHVTSDAAHCGVEVSLPSVSASVSVSGLPPIAVGIPGVKVTVPVDVPTSVPTGLPGGGGGSSSAPGNHTSSPPTDEPNPIPVPARVVPGANGSGLLGGGGFGSGVLPGSDGGGTQLGTGDGSLAGATNGDPADPAVQQDSTGKHKTIDLAANRPASTGEVWVVLAIVAVIALAFVAATYARLYLIKHES